MTWRFTDSLDFDVTLEHIARSPLPDLADWCVAYTPGDGDVRVPRILVAHANSDKEDLLRSLFPAHPLTLPRSHPLLMGMAGRKPLALTSNSAEVQQTLYLTERHTRVLHEVGLRSVLVLPMIAHGLVLGAIMLVRATSERNRLDDVGLEWANALASCAASAIYSAQLFWEARLAARMREQLLSADSELLLSLATKMEHRVSELRVRVPRTGRVSHETVHRGLADIEIVAAAIGQRIQDLQLLASDRVAL